MVTDSEYNIENLYLCLKIKSIVSMKEMKESIIIRNFGPINEVEIENIRPLTILIGESGSGKSTVMKVLVLFRWIYKMVNIRSYLKHAGITKSPFTFDFDRYLSNNGLVGYIKEDTEIIYTRGNNTIAYKGGLNASALIEPEDLCLDKMSFIGDKRNIIPDMLVNKVSKKSTDYFLNEVFDDFIRASKEITELSLDYLGIKFVTKKTNSGIKYFIENNSENEDYTINFEYSSSGTQTVTPLSVIVEYFSKRYDLVKSFNNAILGYMSHNDQLGEFRPVKNIGDIVFKNVHLHVEEPELSLYSESQRSLMNFIVNRCFVDKPSNYNMTVMMATHSPYIINHINLLILAAKKGITEEGAMIDFNKVDVFEITDGYLNDLRREEKFIIDTRPLSVPISNIYESYN